MATPQGKYKTKTEASGAEYAHVDYGIGPDLGEIPRNKYEENEYSPPFDELPTKEEYDSYSTE